MRPLLVLLAVSPVAAVGFGRWLRWSSNRMAPAALARQGPTHCTVRTYRDGVLVACSCGYDVTRTPDLTHEESRRAGAVA